LRRYWVSFETRDEGALTKRVNDMMPKVATDKDGMADSAKALAF
jgi:hypothetical protein